MGIDPQLFHPVENYGIVGEFAVFLWKTSKLLWKTPVSVENFCGESLWQGLYGCMSQMLGWCRLRV